MTRTVRSHFSPNFAVPICDDGFRRHLAAGLARRVMDGPCEKHGSQASRLNGSPPGIVVTAVLWLVLTAVPLAHTSAAAPAPPRHPVAVDHPNDVGDEIDLRWELSPDDRPEIEPRLVTGYRISRSSDVDSGWIVLGRVDYGTTKYRDRHARRGRSYRYRLTALGSGGTPSLPIETAEAATAKMQFFDRSRGWFAVILVVICSSVVMFILIARSGRPLKVRKIAGLEVVDEAVGRATEMGRSCLFVPGIADMDDIQTVAGMTVLSRVARTAAEYDAQVEVPTARSLVMTAAQETVEAAYLTAGRPDAFNINNIYYVTDEQFGYVAYLSGMMVREKPAACFYMGSFYAESLILAETGNAIGAIQIAGTAQPAQLPFFVAACDYTLIGEEFFAASAYLSGEADQLGALKGQDIGKVIVAGFLFAGCVLATWIAVAPKTGWVGRLLGYLMETVLNSGGPG